MDEAVSVEKLTKYYNGHLAVDNISFKVSRGEVFGFLGPNGAGKTSTIKMLVGLTAPSSGTASVAGYDILDDIIEVKQRVGVVPETSNLYDELTVWENLLFVSRLYHVPKPERPERIESLLETFQLTDRRKTKFGKLSKGLKRRVVIAAAMVHQPEVIFLDEPTAGLDVMSALSLRDYIRELRAEDTTVLLTTHYIEEADQLCDRIAILVKGKIATIDTSENIKRSVRGTPVIEAFLSAEPSGKFSEEMEKHGKLELDGRRIRVETVYISEVIESLVQSASREGLDIEEINTLRPNLEDAFVEITGVTPETMRTEKEQGRR